MGKTLQLHESDTQPAVDESNPLGLRKPLDTPWLVPSLNASPIGSNQVLKDTWRLIVDPQSRPVHPIRQFLDSLPALPVTDNAAKYLKNWQANIVAALVAMPSNEKLALESLKKLLDKEELGLCLVDQFGARVDCQRPEHEAMVEAQFVALAVSRNEYLHRIADDSNKTFQPHWLDSASAARNKAAAKTQAKVLIQANEGFRPYRVALRNQCDIAAIAAAFDAGTLAAEDALLQIDTEIGALDRQIESFQKVLDDEKLPDTVMDWVGNEVVQIQTARKQELEAARSGIIKQISARNQ